MQESIEDDFQNEGFRAWNYIVPRGRGKEGFKQRRQCMKNAQGEKVGAQMLREDAGSPRVRQSHCLQPSASHLKSIW